MQGCGAVVHIAGVIDLNAKTAKATQYTNLKSIDSVLSSACELGIEKFFMC